MIRPSSREMIERLVGFDTVSAKSNLALIDFVQDYLESRGARCRRIGNAEGTKANLLASLVDVRERRVELTDDREELRVPLVRDREARVQLDRALEHAVCRVPFPGVATVQQT